VHGKAANLSGLPIDPRHAVGSAPLRSNTHQVHVLVADGDDVSRELRQAQLRTAGCRVSLARTGFEAIVKASCHTPDVILLDESLSDIGAADTNRLIATCPVTSHIPVLRLHPGQRLPRRVLAIARQSVL
jgi:CheY-like chemotaxis protein